MALPSRSSIWTYFGARSRGLSIGVLHEDHRVGWIAIDGLVVNNPMVLAGCGK